MTPLPISRVLMVIVVGAAMAGTTGCIVVKPVVGVGTAVAGAAAKTTVKVTTKAAGAVADAVVPDGEPSGPNEAASD